MGGIPSANALVAAGQTLLTNHTFREVARMAATEACVSGSCDMCLFCQACFCGGVGWCLKESYEPKQTGNY